VAGRGEMGGLEINEISSWEKFQSLVEILKDSLFILETAFKRDGKSPANMK
jgi:hypothetical protein